MLDMCDDGRSMKSALIALGVALLFAACSPAQQPRKVATAKIPVVAAVPGSVTPRSTLGGLIVPFQNVQITSTLVEPADRVLVNEGDHVSKGQLLAQLDTADLQAQLQSAMGTYQSDVAKTKQTVFQSALTIDQNSNSVNSGQAAVRQAQQTLATDQLNLTRDAQLMKQGYIAQQAYDQQATLVANDQQAVRTAQVNLQNTQKQVVANGTTTSGLQGETIASVKADEVTEIGVANGLRVSISKAAIVSPIDGVVVNRNINPGEYPGTRQIFTLQETDKVYAVLNGSGDEIVGVRTGSPVKIASLDRALLHGTAAVSAVLDQLTPGSTNFVVKAVLSNPRNVFHSGMVITGQVQRPTTTGVRIPRSAFTDDTQTSVQTIVKTPDPQGGPPIGEIKTIPVTMVAEDTRNAVVLGLRKGQFVVVNGQLGLTDGQPAVPLTGKPGRTVAER
jgi:multidrug efflux pump subunit AcrA (membrane-fusion protein)